MTKRILIAVASAMLLSGLASPAVEAAPMSHRSPSHAVAQHDRHRVEQGHTARHHHYQQHRYQAPKWARHHYHPMAAHPYHHRQYRQWFHHGHGGHD